MLGIIIGAISGAAQFILLLIFTRAVSGGKFDTKSVLLALCQFLLPLVVLLGSAFIVRDDLVWAGVSMASVLTVCAVVHFLVARRRK